MRLAGFGHTTTRHASGSSAGNPGLSSEPRNSSANSPNSNETTPNVPLAHPAVDRNEKEMRVAGVEIRDSAAAHLVCLLHDHGAHSLAFHLAHAIDHLHEDVGLTGRDRQAVLRALTECPDGLADLRAKLLADQIGGGSREQSAWAQPSPRVLKSTLGDTPSHGHIQ
jgi:hypothetical protein